MRAVDLTGRRTWEGLNLGTLSACVDEILDGRVLLDTDGAEMLYDTDAVGAVPAWFRVIVYAGESEPQAYGFSNYDAWKAAHGNWVRDRMEVTHVRIFRAREQQLDVISRAWAPRRVMTATGRAYPVFPARKVYALFRLIWPETWTPPGLVTSTELYIFQARRTLIGYTSRAVEERDAGRGVWYPR